MADDTESDPRDGGDEQDDPRDAAPDLPEEEMSSREALKKGMGLLWKAAKTAADEIQRDVDLDAVKSSLERAGRDIEVAAQEAARTLEDFIERKGPQTSNPSYSESWPPPDTPKSRPAGSDDTAADAATTAPSEGDVPGTDTPTEDPTGNGRERRDLRIQVDDD